jgi:hypothetical protein
MLDPIDSLTGSHQDEGNSGFIEDKGNSGFIDLTNPTSDYLSDQLRFILNQLRLG